MKNFILNLCIYSTIIVIAYFGAIANNSYCLNFMSVGIPILTLAFFLAWTYVTYSTIDLEKYERIMKSKVKKSWQRNILRVISWVVFAILASGGKFFLALSWFLIILFSYSSDLKLNSIGEKLVEETINS